MPNLSSHIIIFFISIFVTSCGIDNLFKKKSSSASPVPILPPIDTPFREPAEENYSFVGYILTGSGRCSGTILRHGIFVTAKHCFSDQVTEPSDLSQISLQFSQPGIMSDQSNLAISGDEIQEVVYDGLNTDIAYILYTPNSTLTVDYLEAFVSEFLTTRLEDEKSVTIVGFPSQSRLPLRRLISQNCEFSGKREEMPRFSAPVVNYDGILYDTTCFAWYGDSGGPVYEIDENKNPIRILGVVSHTFDIDERGEILEETILEDEFGSHVSTTNFSPFSEADRVEEIIARLE
ncbi:MAG: trypsin-like serine protease [Candidatus Magasanikbacteria bacterium]|nr:trypsin-like serine protease [Candidatus Magasanikbacteria bacterium]